MDMELEFDDLWSRSLETLPRGGSIPAERVFALLGSVDEEKAAQTLQALTDREIGLEVAALPRLVQGQATPRLELEESLTHQGKMPWGLEPSDPLRQYWKEVEALPALREDPARDLGQREEDVNRLAEGLLWLVTEEAPGFVGQGVLLLDLMQEGAMGLLQALEQPGGCSLERARWYVRQAMARTVAMQYLVSGEAQRLLAAMRAYQQADRRLLRQLGRNPGPEELAQELGKTRQEILSLEKMVRQAAQMPKTPEQPRQQEEEPEAVESSAWFQIRSRVEELLSALEETDRRILILRFGLEGKQPQSQEETAQTLGLTLENVQNRELAAMAFLRTK